MATTNTTENALRHQAGHSSHTSPRLELHFMVLGSVPYIKPPKTQCQCILCEAYGIEQINLEANLKWNPN